MTRPVFVRLAPLLGLSLFLVGCQGDLENHQIDTSIPLPLQDSASIAASSPLWADDPALLEPVSLSLVTDLRALLSRLEVESNRLAQARSKDCAGATPAILPVITHTTSLLDTLYLLKPMFTKAPPNLDASAAIEWDKAGQAIGFLFPDGRLLLKTSKITPLSEALIRAYGLSMNARAQEADNSLKLIETSLAIGSGVK